MWQRDVERSVLPPRLDRRSQRLFATAAQEVALGVLPDEEREFNPWQPR
jgi:hypothetical protein